MPVYFGNVCLRFLPVLDIVIHRFLEAPGTSAMNVNKPLESILSHLGCLYKFHGNISKFKIKFQHMTFMALNDLNVVFQ